MRGEVRDGRCVGRQAACTEKARLKAWGTGHARQRTANMLLMFVTLEVSKRSGWLNADALCRVDKEGVRYGARCGTGGVRGCGAASGMHGEGPT